MADRFHTTSVAQSVAATLDLGAQAFRDRLAAARAPGDVVELDANIGGATIRLRSNDDHLLGWWRKSWTHAASGKVDAVLHACTGVPGAAAQGAYAPELHEAMLVNTDYYGQCKSWALGLAAGILERRGILSIHGASLELHGRGVVLVGGSGSGKSTQVAQLARRHGAKLLGDDWAFAEQQGGRVRLTQPERFFYIRTDAAAHDDALAAALDDAPVENAIRSRGACTSRPCREGRCMFDRGRDHCLWGNPEARALVPRQALAGPAGLVDEAWLDVLVVLRRDPAAPARSDDPPEVLDALHEGRSQGGSGVVRQPFYNPHLLHGTASQERLFAQAIAGRRALLLNTARLGIEATAQAIADAARGDPLR